MIHTSVCINTLRLTPYLIPSRKLYLTDLLPHVRHRNARFEPQAHKRIIYESRDVFSGSKISSHIIFELSSDPIWMYTKSQIFCRHYQETSDVF